MFIFTEKCMEADSEFDILVQEANEAIIHHFKEYLYPKIEKVLLDPSGSRRFSNFVSTHVNKNINKLTTIGPVYQIPFTHQNKDELYSIFGLEEKDILDMIKKSRTELHTSIPSWQSISQNPVFCVLYYIIRFFTIKQKSKELNNALIIFALAIYPSIFHKYFRHYTINTAVMQYTIDNLSQRFSIKKNAHLFATLTQSIQNSWKFHEKNIIEGSDNNCVEFAWRVHNDQNSLIKKIAQNYFDNKNKGNMITTQVDSFEDNNVIDVENNTNKVESQVNKIVMNIIVNGIDLKICDFASNATSVSKIELRNCMTSIIKEKNSEVMKEFVESILFMFLYNDKHVFEEINSKMFISYCLALFKKSNSKDPNIVKMKSILDKWGTESGIYGRFNRLATRVDYTRAIMLYFTLSIQKYN